MKHGLWAMAACLMVGTAQADAVDKLRTFVREVQSGRAGFQQTVTTPDGVRRRDSSGSFEFSRPNRFRFDYAKPYPELIVADGTKVWVFDPDLKQVTVRKFDQALGATPAALLAGATLERDFTLAPAPSMEGVDWARATPKVADGAFQWMAVGFRGDALVEVEILDRFGQRTLLRLDRFESNVPMADDRFRFKPPPGVDVVEQ